jgi:hypothetical protein
LCPIFNNAEWPEFVYFMHERKAQDFNMALQGKPSTFAPNSQKGGDGKKRGAGACRT